MNKTGRGLRVYTDLEFRPSAKVVAGTFLKVDSRRLQIHLDIRKLIIDCRTLILDTRSQNQFITLFF